jgi:3-hydroxymyristoyl/3-hydroxydecanoyl-(acyl carrier protein) dehydratase
MPHAHASTYRLPRTHPALAGHFPGNPIVPGVLLLDEALHVIANSLGIRETDLRLMAIKFLSSAAPDELLHFEHQQLPNGHVRFAYRAPDRLIATGTAERL